MSTRKPKKVDSLPTSYNLVLDKSLRQVLPGDYVLLPCFNSVVDRGMVLNVIGSTCEIMILSPESGIPETLVIDFRNPDRSTGLFGRYGYTGIKVCARKGEPMARDFARQLISTCKEMSRQSPQFNPYLVAQANARVEFLSEALK